VRERAHGARAARGSRRCCSSRIFSTLSPRSAAFRFQLNERQRAICAQRAPVFTTSCTHTQCTLAAIVLCLNARRAFGELMKSGLAQRAMMQISSGNRRCRCASPSNVFGGIRENRIRYRKGQSILVFNSFGERRTQEEKVQRNCYWFMSNDLSKPYLEVRRRLENKETTCSKFILCFWFVAS
jgi:hypothetical protein